MFSPSYLEAIERGRIPLDEDVVDRIVDLYEVESGPVLPGRSKLLLDLEQQRLHVGSSSISFDSPTADALLERYVSLLYLLRDTTPGKRLTLRDDDLNVLGESLGRNESRLRDELLAIMASNETVDRTARLARRKAVLGAGLLVGATAVGSLVIVTQTLPESLSSNLDEPAALLAVPVEASIASSVEPVLPTPLAKSVRLPGVPAMSDAPGLIAVAPQGAADVGGSFTAEASSAEDLGARAEALVDYDFRSALPAWQFEFAGDNEEWHGVTNSVTKTITIYVESESTAESVGSVLMHEIGHAIDIEFLSDDQRREWVGLRNMPATWWTGDGLSDFAVGAGDFAEAVAAFTMGSPSQSVYGEFTAAQMAFVEAVLESDTKI